ncbi:MAG: hypothetical protein NTX50_10070 [Candidatus Sumerlaeota bacterium]|nr:hypothetical protein [Candidatus Sumerlaeota bacterium]
MRICLLAFTFSIACAFCPAQPGSSADNTTSAPTSPVWSKAYLQKPPLNADETRAFMKQLATFVFEHHTKRDGSAQRGMTYEYFWVEKQGTPQQWIQGEALDTMHDGAWFAAAMTNAYRATGDPFYKEILTQWQLPFYLKMLNHSDELFTSERNDGRPGDDRGWRGSKEWLLQGREKGFVPYWWDDGKSVSLEMLGRKDKDDHVNFAARNEMSGRPNPERRLSGYSHGSSNHLAQDLAVMLQTAGMLLKGSDNAADKELSAEIAEAAKNLQECRARHGSPNIPAVLAALAVSSCDEALRKKLPEETWATVATGRSDYRRALFDYKKDEPMTLPGFADDQEYRYYVALARDSAITSPVAFRFVYDAYTLPMLYRLYCDDEPTPPGINVFDLHPYKFLNGKPADVRSERKGPNGKPRPIGSRFGPQNMVVTGWGLQALRAQKGLWDSAKARLTAPNFFPKSGKRQAAGDSKAATENETASESEVFAALEKELSLGLRTWKSIFDEYGYIPTGIGCNSVLPGTPWDKFSDTGGYAHLISAAAQWLFYLEGRRDSN